METKNQIGMKLLEVEIEFAAKSYLMDGYINADAIAAGADDVKERFDVSDSEINTAIENLKNG